MTRRPPGTDPDDPSVPAAPADVPDRTAPPSRSAPGTSETLPAGVPSPADPDPVQPDD